MTTTTNLGMTLPTVGADSDAWGDLLDAALNIIDAYLAPGQFKATATNDSAAAGKVGEYISSSIVVASAVSLTNSTWANVTSVSLTAGDWDVVFEPRFSGGATTTVTCLGGTITTTSATPDTTVDREAFNIFASFTPFVTNDQALTAVGPARFSLSSATTVYGAAFALFGASTCKAYGALRARRVR